MHTETRMRKLKVRKAPYIRYSLPCGESLPPRNQFKNAATVGKEMGQDSREYKEETYRGRRGGDGTGKGRRATSSLHDLMLESRDRGLGDAGRGEDRRKKQEALDARPPPLERSRRRGTKQGALIPRFERRDSSRPPM
jgi:hypothetical protein